MHSSKNIRPDVKERIIKEQNAREEQNFKPNYVFSINPKKMPLTGKFYSYYEMDDLSKADPEILNRIRDIKDNLPQNKYSEPQTESQEIGWYYQQYLPIRKDDRRFYCPRVDHFNIAVIESFKKKNSR